MMMMLMYTVSYAGDVHNHVLGINDFITLSGVLLYYYNCNGVFETYIIPLSLYIFLFFIFVFFNQKLNFQNENNG